MAQTRLALCTELKLVRKWFTEKSTIGELFIDNEFQCFILEDVVRGFKIAGETAIPAGRYEVRITFSERFQRELPILIAVPGYVGIRIHGGNTAKDTLGCLLTGTERHLDTVSHSQLALEALLKKLRTCPGPMFITIVEEGEMVCR